MPFDCCEYVVHFQLIQPVGGGGGGGAVPFRPIPSVRGGGRCCPLLAHSISGGGGGAVPFQPIQSVGGGGGVLSPFVLFNQWGAHVC